MVSIPPSPTLEEHRKSTSDRNDDNDITLEESDWKMILHKFEQNVALSSQGHSCRFPGNKQGGQKVKFKFHKNKSQTSNRAKNRFIQSMIHEGSPCLSV